MDLPMILIIVLFFLALYWIRKYNLQKLINENKSLDESLKVLQKSNAQLGVDYQELKQAATKLVAPATGPVDHGQLLRLMADGIAEASVLNSELKQMREGIKEVLALSIVPVNTKDALAAMTSAHQRFRGLNELMASASAGHRRVYKEGDSILQHLDAFTSESRRIGNEKDQETSRANHAENQLKQRDDQLKMITLERDQYTSSLTATREELEKERTNYRTKLTAVLNGQNTTAQAAVDAAIGAIGIDDKLVEVLVKRATTKLMSDAELDAKDQDRKVSDLTIKADTAETAAAEFARYRDLSLLGVEEVEQRWKHLPKIAEGLLAKRPARKHSMSDPNQRFDNLGGRRDRKPRHSRPDEKQPEANA